MSDTHWASQNFSEFTDSYDKTGMEAVTKSGYMYITSYAQMK